MSQLLVNSRLILPGMLMALMGACGQQGPSFNERRDAREYESADARVQGKGTILPPESDDARKRGAGGADAAGQADAAAGSDAGQVDEGEQPGPGSADDHQDAGDSDGGDAVSSDGGGKDGSDGGGTSGHDSDDSAHTDRGDGGSDAGADDFPVSGDGGASDGTGNGGASDGTGNGGASDGGATSGGGATAGAGDGGISDATADGGGDDVAGGGDASEGDGGAADSTCACADGDDSGDAGGADGGIGGSFRVVELLQAAPGKVDILWVVDTSGSMAEEQRYLADNFNALISQLKSAGHDFQTAITTTDICQDAIPSDLAERVCPVSYGGSPATHLRGSFVGAAGRKVLKKSDADLVSKFAEYTSQGVDGSGFEHGLKGAQMAIAKVLSGANEPLVRDDAFLAVIVVSDEEDDGIGLSQVDAYHGHNFYEEGLTTFRYTEDDFIDYLQGVKGEGNFSVSAITPTRLPNGSLCSAPHTSPAEEGKQYIAAAAKSGGILQSICDTNWNTSLAEIGLDLSAQITQVVLPSAPDVATIVVKVDGAQTSYWSYNQGNNAVKFDAGHVPAEGARIKITYYEP